MKNIAWHWLVGGVEAQGAEIPFFFFVFVYLMTLRGCATLLCPSLVRGPSRRQVGCCKTNPGAHYSLDSDFTWGLGGGTVWLGYRELG